MRALFSGALLLTGLLSHATAEQAVSPVTLKNSVNGVPIYVSATSWVTVKSVGDEFLVDARIFADLVDLQKKFSSVVGTLKPPADGCTKQVTDYQRPVASLNRGSLWPREDQLLINIRGDIDIWSCVVGPSKTKLQWHKKKIGFLNLKVPSLHTAKDVKKSKDGTQSFRGTLPIYLVRVDDATVALKVADPKISLEGDEESITNTSLQLATADISRQAYRVLQRAIDPAKLRGALPDELQKLNMTVVSARFRDQGGHAIAEINLSARVLRDSIPLLLRQTSVSQGNGVKVAAPIVYSLR
jgi:hypothetical protein